MLNGFKLLKLSLITLAVWIGAAIILGQPAFAQEDDGLGTEASAPAAPASSGKTPVATDSKGQPKRTTIDFEDELVEGKTKNPELFYLLQKRQFNYKRLIRLRENFLPEMRKTSEDMQRKGSVD